MKRVPVLIAAVAVCSLIALMSVNADDKKAEPNMKAQVAHLVFYTLNDDTPENRATLLGRIDKYLSGHEGVVHFSAGEIAEDMNRSVNDRGFHVSMNFVFANRKAHDTYNDHPKHEEFKAINKGLIAKVRVFDTYLVSKASK